MKSLFYVLATVAIAAAAFFGWTAKENYTAQLEARDEVIQANATLSKNIKQKELEEADAVAAKALALDAESRAKQGLEAAVAKSGEFESTIESLDADLEIAAADKKKVDDSIAALEGQFPGIALEEVPRVVNEMEAKEKKLVGDEQAASDTKKSLEEEVARNLAEASRVNEKVEESVRRVEGNTFQAMVTAVDNDWNFVVIGAGEKSGLTGDSKLLVQRDGLLLAKLLISKLEPNSAVADIEPGTLRVGVALRPGDQVILETVRSN